MNLKDIVLSPATRILLEVNGEDDGLRGIDQYQGWKEICDQMGFSSGHTPAQEAYLDGWYRGATKKAQKAS